MITLVLEAGRIPDGTYVRKPTGQYQFVVHRKLKIYTSDDKREILSEGMVFLVPDGSSSINAYPENTLLAVDLDERDALIFIDDNLIQKE